MQFAQGVAAAVDRVEIEPLSGKRSTRRAFPAFIFTLDLRLRSVGSSRTINFKR